nr:thiamine phosphate synthase [uncultured Sphingomonas sp.]
MPARQDLSRAARTWPRRWLMTDERMGDQLFAAIRRLPRGSGVVFRHDRLPGAERARLARSVARLCRRRGLMLAVARDSMLARRVGADLVHQPTRFPGLLPISRSVHNANEAAQARRYRTALVFVSPLFPTNSHPDRPSLGWKYGAELARIAGVPAVALGGMNESGLADAAMHGFIGYAGIDCWLG